MPNYERTYWILFFTVGILFSCNNNNEPEPETELIEQQTIDPINLMDCQTEKFEVLFEKLEEFLPLMGTGCTVFKVAYKPIPEEEKSIMTKYMSEVVANHFTKNRKLDSTIFFQEFEFSTLDFCEPTIEYDSSDSCSFYAGVIYHTKDYKIQFIRLFQDGSEEYFDLFVDLTKTEPEVFGFG